MEFILNVVTYRYARALLRSSSSGFFVACVLLASNQVSAASNEALLNIIERLEQRIEQLESQSNETDEVTSQPLARTPSVSLAPIQIPVVRKISMTPPPVQPLELIPTTSPAPPVPPTAASITVTEADGVWMLFLNLESAQPDQLVQSFIWEDIRKTFRVTDDNGASRLLTVDVAMQGDGKRTKTGRSFLLRTNYDYDFRYVISYQLYLDGVPILSAQKYLSSHTLEIDHRGMIPPKIFHDLENQHVDKINEAPLQVRFGCQKEAPTALTNRRAGEAAFRQLNTYACLVLDFNE